MTYYRNRFPSLDQLEELEITESISPGTHLAVEIEAASSSKRVDRKDVSEQRPLLHPLDVEVEEEPHPLRRFARKELPFEHFDWQDLAQWQELVQWHRFVQWRESVLWRDFIPSKKLVRAGARQVFAALIGASMVLSFMYIHQAPMQASQLRESASDGRARLDSPRAAAVAAEESRAASATWRLHSEEQMQWAANGTCWSIHERHKYYPRASAAAAHRPAPAFLSELRKYEKMHQRCVAGVGDWAEHFAKLKPGYTACQYLVWYEPESGVGNRLMSLLSAFLYALLTGRALLVNTNRGMPNMLCEPFPRSSWWTPRSLPDTLWKAPHQGEFANGSTSNWGHQPTGRRDIVGLFLTDEYWRSDQQFFCGSMQRLLSNHRLSLLFPDRVVLGPLARYLLHPQNAIWDRVIRTHRASFQHATNRVGVQVRTYGAYDEGINQRVVECATSIGVLPNPISHSQLDLFLKSTASVHDSSLDEGGVGGGTEVGGGAAAAAGAGGAGAGAVGGVGGRAGKARVAVFVASTHQGHSEYLQRVFSERPTEDHSVVAVHTEAKEVAETGALTADQQAVAEIWLLSMCHTLLITYMSNFGYLASGIAGQPAYLMNIAELEWRGQLSSWRTNGKPECEKAWSAEGCQLYAPQELKCSRDPRGDGTGARVDYHRDYDPGVWLPYLRHCQDREQGLTLLPTFKFG
eukprot:jgi/Mesen1/410/ME000100S10646